MCCEVSSEKEELKWELKMCKYERGNKACGNERIFKRERERKVLQVVKRQKKVDTLTKNKLDTWHRNKGERKRKCVRERKRKKSNRSQKENGVQSI